MKYIVSDEPRNYTSGDIFNDEFDTLDQAISAADNQWSHLTFNEKKARTIYVLESINPDEEAPDHFDGMPIWKDGISTSAIWKISETISNDVLDELGSEANEETRWTFDQVCLDAENYEMFPDEFASRYLEEVIE